jgi:hypothetical protein
MLGLNGGLMGVRKVPTPGTASGLWDQNEQSVARRANIWPGSDPSFADVSLLLHMDGTNGSTTFTDASTNGFTVITNGNAQISTAQSKFGGASGYFDGTGDYLSIADANALDFETGDFTVEFWFYLTASSSNGKALISKGTWPTNTASYFIFYGGSNELAFYASDNGASWQITNQLLTSNPTKEAWHHVAVTRNGTAFRGFFNGVKGFDHTSSIQLHNNASALTIGSGASGSEAINAYIDDLRITKGVARYTANFTPPTAAFP